MTVEECKNLLKFFSPLEVSLMMLRLEDICTLNTACAEIKREQLNDEYRRMNENFEDWKRRVIDNNLEEEKS